MSVFQEGASKFFTTPPPQIYLSGILAATTLRSHHMPANCMILLLQKFLTCWVETQLWKQTASVEDLLNTVCKTVFLPIQAIATTKDIPTVTDDDKSCIRTF